MEERRTHPGFLSDGEAARDRKRTEDFVRSLANCKQSKPDPGECRLCDSCGNPVQVDKWRCKKCNIAFCVKCGQDFGEIQKKMLPDCPMCGEKLDPKGKVKLLLDKQIILRYLKSTNAKDQDEDELCRRIARIFNKDIIYAKQIWSTIKQEHPILLSQMNNRIGAQQNAQQTHPGFTATNPNERKPKTFRPNSIYNPPSITKPNKTIEKENLEIKDLKPLDGFESEWKQGKLKPAEQKNYRSTFQDK